MTICLSTNGVNAHSGDAPPTKLLVATAHGVSTLERSGRGAPWSVTSTALAELHPSSLLIDPASGAIYAGIHDGGLYFSGDDGATWQRRAHGLSIEHVFSLRLLNGPTRAVLAGTEPVSLFKSEDQGQSWTELPAVHQVPNMEKWTFPGPPHIAHTKSVAIDPRDTRRMYLGVEQGGLLKTEDGGASWREIDSYYTPQDMWYRDIHQIALRPSQPDELFMTTGIGFYRSEDAGLTWTHVTGPESRVGYPDQLVFSPLDDSVVYHSGARRDPMTWRQSGRADATVLRSHDAGRTWEPAGRGLPDQMRHNIEAMGVAGYPGGYMLFIGDTGGNVFASEDEAESWTLIAEGLAPISKGGHYRAFQAAA
ncbi:MAG TPA: sialidase family protein [Chloroflexota bacterium]|nr:sialidase family protein [Chloroflexota bacterium]